MNVIAPGFMEQYLWPPTGLSALDDSLCYHSKQFLEASSRQDLDSLCLSLPQILNQLETTYSCTKVCAQGYPTDFEKLIREVVDWNASPGWPWRANYPTNRDLFLFDGVRCDAVRVKMVEAAVQQRLADLLEGPKADPIFVFIKPEPHKVSKRDKKSWRLISGVGLTDTLVDRLLYGNWLDKLVQKWNAVPSKAGWTPSGGGYLWMAKAFRGQLPMSIDKSSWDWTVNKWHIDIIKQLIPRMVFRRSEQWDVIFKNRMSSLFDANQPVFKTRCGCEFTQLVDGIMKSGTLGTIGFNSIWQFASHIAIGGDPEEVFFSLGDDTTQEAVRLRERYVEMLQKTGCIVKEIDVGFPIKFGGHEFSEDGCVPAYRAKHMFNLLYLDPKVARETMDSYQHLYALDPEVLDFLQERIVDLFGVEAVLSKEYLEYWYKSLE